MTVIGLSFATARKIFDEYAPSSIQGTCFAVGIVLLPSLGLIGAAFHGDCAENKRGEALVARTVVVDVVVAEATDEVLDVAAEPVTTLTLSVVGTVSTAGEFSPLLAYARTGKLDKNASIILRSTSFADVELPELSA